MKVAGRVSALPTVPDRAKDPAAAAPRNVPAWRWSRAGWRRLACAAPASLGAMLAPRDQHREAAQAAPLARCLANPRDGAEVPKAREYT